MCADIGSEVPFVAFAVVLFADFFAIFVIFFRLCYLQDFFACTGLDAANKKK